MSFKKILPSLITISALFNLLFFWIFEPNSTVLMWVFALTITVITTILLSIISFLTEKLISIIDVEDQGSKILEVLSEDVGCIVIVCADKRRIYKEGTLLSVYKISQNKNIETLFCIGEVLHVQEENRMTQIKIDFNSNWDENKLTTYNLIKDKNINKVKLKTIINKKDIEV